MGPPRSTRVSSSASPSLATAQYSLFAQQHSSYDLDPRVPYNPVSHPQVTANTFYSSTPSYSQGYQSSHKPRTRLASIPSASIGPVLSLHSKYPRSTASPPETIGNEYNGGIKLQSDYPSSTDTYSLPQPLQAPVATMSRGFEGGLGHEAPSSNYHGAPHEGATSTPSYTAPPFEGTKSMVRLYDRNGHTVHPEITAKIEKGFFKVDDQWVCYRRNYFTVLCTFDIVSNGLTAEPIYMQRSGSQSAQIQSFALTISAKADSEDGKSIDLVQHTPKRDKGPMNAPERKELKPNPGGNLSAGFQSNSMPYTGLGHNQEYDGCGPAIMDSQMVAAFERMQFKKATANNGKRRAAQQYFYLIVELHGKVRDSRGGDEWTKIAHRVSSKMVVRGRSPGHYQDERRASAQTGGGSGHMGYDGNSGSFLNGASMEGPMPTSGMPGFSRHSTFTNPHTSLARTNCVNGSLLAPVSISMHGLNLPNFQDEFMDIDGASQDHIYHHHDFGNLPSPPSHRGPTSLRQSSNNSPNSMGAIGYSYPTPLSIKEDARIPTTKVEPRLHGSKSPLAGPSFAMQWAAPELRGSRDCRTLVGEPHRSLYPEPSAL